MNKFLVFILIIIFISGCYDKFESSKRIIAIDEIESINLDKFEFWSIDPRDNITYIFKKQRDSAGVTITDSFFMVRKKNEVLFFIDVLDKRKNSYVEYSKLKNESQKKLPMDIVSDFFSLGIEKIQYKESRNSKYLFLNGDLNDFWYFFEVDSLQQPVIMDGLERINNKLYQRTH